MRQFLKFMSKMTDEHREPLLIAVDEISCIGPASPKAGPNATQIEVSSNPETCMIADHPFEIVALAFENLESFGPVVDIIRFAEDESRIKEALGPERRLSEGVARAMEKAKLKIN